MKNALERLIKLQDIQLKRGRHAAASKEDIDQLRAGIPGPILAHFDRMIARGKKGVALAKNGVCTGCHLKISSGTWGNLSDAKSIHLCDSCGRYLYRPVEDVPAPVKDAEVNAKPKKRAKEQTLDEAA